MTDRTTSPFPAPVYRETVLRHVFADAQQYFLVPLVDVDLAHVLMLARQGILPMDVAARCLRAILELDGSRLSSMAYDGTVEDLFFLVEGELARVLGTDDAGRIHTARSRNDLDLTMYRMVLRARLLRIVAASLGLRDVLVRLAEEHRSAVMPAYTHNQPAQPTTLGHFFLAYLEVLERDAERLRDCYARVNQSPMGACAITTTGFPIDRQWIAGALGFTGLIVNSYGAIAAVDYVVEACSMLATAVLSLGRFTQEMLLWSTAEFGYLRLSDGYVQISSIMPQKRNPVPLEHVRILASRSLTEAQAVPGSLHNTPFADMNDGEDTLQPLLALAFADGERALTLMAGVLNEATFDTARMRRRAGEAFLPVTELADTLVRVAGMSFHAAHAVVSAAVRAAVTDHPVALAAAVRQRLVDQGIEIAESVLLQALDPEHFVKVREIIGGPAPCALQPQLENSAARRDADRTWCDGEQERLSSTRERLYADARRTVAQHAPAPAK